MIRSVSDEHDRKKRLEFWIRDLDGLLEDPHRAFGWGDIKIGYGDHVKRRLLGLIGACLAVIGTVCVVLAETVIDWPEQSARYALSILCGWGLVTIAVTLWIVIACYSFTTRTQVVLNIDGVLFRSRGISVRFPWMAFRPPHPTVVPDGSGARLSIHLAAISQISRVDSDQEVATGVLASTPDIQILESQHVTIANRFCVEPAHLAALLYAVAKQLALPPKAGRSFT